MIIRRIKLICLGLLIASHFACAEDAEFRPLGSGSCKCPSCTYIDSMCVKTVTDDGWMPFSRIGEYIVASSHCVVISKPFFPDGRRIHNVQCSDSFPEKFTNPEGCILITKNQPDNFDGKTYRLECNVEGAGKAVTELQKTQQSNSGGEFEIEFPKSKSSTF